MARRSMCPKCGMDVAVNKEGRLVQHGRKRDPETKALIGEGCPGVAMKVMEDKSS